MCQSQQKIRTIQYITTLKVQSTQFYSLNSEFRCLFIQVLTELTGTLSTRSLIEDDGLSACTKPALQKNGRLGARHNRWGENTGHSTQ